MGRFSSQAMLKKFLSVNEEILNIEEKFFYIENIYETLIKLNRPDEAKRRLENFSDKLQTPIDEVLENLGVVSEIPEDEEKATMWEEKKLDILRIFVKFTTREPVEIETYEAAIGCIKILQSMLDDFNAKYPNDPANEKIIDTMDEIASSLVDYDAALEIRKEIFCRLKQGNADAKYILYAMKKIALTYEKLKNYSEALKWRKDTYDFCRENFVEDAPEVIEAMENLASVYEKLEDFDNAENLRREIVKIKSEKRGDDSHSDVIYAKKNFGR